MQPTKCAIDTTDFDDPMAKKIDWEPAQVGFSGRNRRLVSINSNRLVFRSPITGLVLIVAFAALSFAAIYDFFAKLLAGQFYAAPLPFFFIFGGLAWLLFHAWSIPIVFDKEKGYFWRGRKVPSPSTVQTDAKRYAALEEIYALQLIKPPWLGRRKSIIYELNLVLRSGDRVHVLVHRSKKRLRSYASDLSAFLQVPVWDVCK